MTETKLPGMVINRIDTKSTYDSLVENGEIGENDLCLVEDEDNISPGDSGTDISLGVTGATVGDIIKVKAVDASGKPTAWEAAGWRTIAEIVTTDQAKQYELTEDSDGNPLNLSEVILRYAYGDAGYSYEKVWINGIEVSYRHGASNNSYQSFYLKKVGEHLYGIDTTTTQNSVSGMNIGLKACGLALNLFPNGEKINSIKFGSAVSNNAYVGVTVTVLGR